MELMDLIEGQYKIISVVGLSKNAGKTVALNEIISASQTRGIKLGITSIGRDGERQDIVTRTDKPQVYVSCGTIVASAEKLIDVSDAGLEIIEISDVTTPIGRVVIARVIREGFTEIAGPSTNADVVKISEKMLHHGADLVLVDGALDRVSSASPVVTEGTVLSTGAVISRDMNKVIAETAHKVGLFKLARLEDMRIKEIINDAIINKSVVVIDIYNRGTEIEEIKIEIVPIKTALSAGGIIAGYVNENSQYVFIPGSLVSKTVVDLMQATDLYRQLTLLVSDATKIFIGQRDWMHFAKAGIHVEVVDEIKLIAVTINPYAPSGYFFDPYLFKSAMTACLEGIPVFDVMGDA